MRAFAYLSQGQAGWVEKAPPQATGFDGIIRPLLVSPCTSDVHNVEIGCLAPHRILGHEGLGAEPHGGILPPLWKLEGTRCGTSRWERSWWCPL